MFYIRSAELSLQNWNFLPLTRSEISHSVVSNSLRPHESQHARPPCPSQTPGVHSDSCPSSQWCHPAISSSVVPFSSCPQPLPASESFPMSQLFAWGGQSIGVSALASFLPKKSQDWSPLEWTGWISLQSKGLSRVFSNTTVQKHQFFSAQLSSQSNSHIRTWPLEKTIALTGWTCVGKVMSLLLNMLPRLDIKLNIRLPKILVAFSFAWYRRQCSVVERVRTFVLTPFNCVTLGKLYFLSLSSSNIKWGYVYLPLCCCDNQR